MTRRAQLDIVLKGDERDAVRAAQNTSRAYKGLGDDVDGGTRRAAGGVGALGSRMAGMASVAGAAVAGAGLVAGAAYSLASSASDAAEAQSAAQAVFQESYAAIAAAASDSARTVGLSRAQYLDAAKSVGTLGAAAGLTGSDLSDFSVGIVGAAADLASFNNTSVDDALTALQSGLRGEAEPLRRFGILLDDATLRQEALKQGLISTTKDALTPQQKTLAAQAVILSQLGAAQGDFARTSDGMANQQRILSAQWEDFKATLGEAFLPLAQKALTWATSMLPALTSLGGGLSQIGTYLEPLGQALALFSGRGDQAKGSADGLAGAWNILTVQGRALAGFLSGLAGPIMGALRDASDKVRASLEAHPAVMRLVQAAAGAIGQAFAQAGTVARALGTAVGTVLGAAMRAAAAAIGVAVSAADRLISAWNTARATVTAAAGAIRSALSNLPGAGVLGAILGRGSLDGLALAATGPMMGGRDGLATASASGVGSWWPSLLGTSSSGPAVVQQVTITVNVETGVGDKVAIGAEVHDVLTRFLRTTGAPLSYGGPS